MRDVSAMGWETEMAMREGGVFGTLTPVVKGRGRCCYLRPSDSNDCISEMLHILQGWLASLPLTITFTIHES